LLWLAAVIATMHRLPAPRRKWLKSRQHLAGGQRCMPAVEVPSQFFFDVIACLRTLIGALAPLAKVPAVTLSRPSGTLAVGTFRPSQTFAG